MSEQKPVCRVGLTNEDLLAVARQVQADQTTRNWDELDEDEQEYYLDWTKEIIATLHLPHVQKIIAKHVYEHEANGNSPPAYADADAPVQFNYKMAVATVAGHFVLKSQPESVRLMLHMSNNLFPAIQRGKAANDPNLMTLAKQARTRKGVIAGPLFKCQDAHKLSDEQLATVVGVSVDQLPHLALCGLPTSDTERAAVALHVHADPNKLLAWLWIWRNAVPESEDAEGERTE